MTFPKLLENCRKPNGAEIGRVRAVERELGCALPAEYVEVLLVCDGLEGPVGTSSLMLWPVSELVSSNFGYGVEELLPGAVLFGNDRGGAAYGFRMRGEHVEYFAVPLIGMRHDECRVFGSTFDAFLERIAAAEPEVLRKERRVPCPRCGQEWLRRVRLRLLNRKVILCLECDALWPTEADVAQLAFEDYGTFMKRHERENPHGRSEMAIEGFVLRSTG